MIRRGIAAAGRGLEGLALEREAGIMCGGKSEIGPGRTACCETRQSSSSCCHDGMEDRGGIDEDEDEDKDGYGVEE